jgi:hypothetical protein
VNNLEEWNQDDDLEDMLLMDGYFDKKGPDREQSSPGGNNSGCATMIVLVILIISLFSMVLW